MLRNLRTLLGCVIVLLLITGPMVLAFRMQKQMREFREVRAGLLYRSGQMRILGLKQVVHDYGVRTIITLRDKAVSGSLPIDLAEEKFCANEEISYYRFPLLHWEAADGSAPVEENVRKFREILKDPRNHPVLIHCQAGIHRTGAYCAVFRMEYDHWSNQKAIEELKASGYSNLENEWDILGYLERYQPTWKDKEVGVPPAGAPKVGQVKRW
jgi:tyrosine-protein phosphatase SIW14